MSKIPLVSIIIPTYKRSDTLPCAIDSVLAQKYENKEIIVVDDNDPLSDFRRNTELVMEKYSQEPSVRYIRHERNKNGSAARNTGFRASSGDYIMFLDDDDEFLNNKIEAQVNTLEGKTPDWGACYTKYIRMHNGAVHSTCNERKEGNLLKEELMRDLWVAAGSNLMIRRDVLEELNGFDESFVRNQDVEFLVRFFKKYKLAFTDELGLCVNYHTTQTVKYSFEDVTKSFLKTFEEEIKSLSEKDSKDVYQMINLQRFRNYLFNEKSISKAVGLIKNKEITIANAFFYLTYLINRKITRSCYSYKIR